MGQPFSVITIGNFDGVHLGHVALVRRARGLMEELRSRGGGGGRVVALAFDPHPAAALSPGFAPAVLTGFEERRRLLLAAGADEVKRLTPTPELLSHSATAFLDWAVGQWGAKGIVEGHDFHFGKGRAGTPEVLLGYARERGLCAEIVDPVLVDLCDQTLVRASSTMVRWLLGQGRVTDAHRVLGRAHGVAGKVVGGDRRGRTIGFPTANLDLGSVGGVMLPRDGVYAAAAWVAGDETARAAAVHIGPRATFDAPRRVVEAHIIGWDGAVPGVVPDGYGWGLRLGFLAHLREPMKLDGLEGLRGQLRRDTERAAGIFARYGVGATDRISPELTEAHA